MLRKKRWRSLADMMAFLLLGIAAVTLPVLGYFALHGALGDLFQSYFYNNLFLYSRDPSLFQLRRNVGRGLFNSTLLYLSILFSLVWLIGKRDLRLAGLYILSLGFLMFTSLNSVHPMRYYTFAFIVNAQYIPDILFRHQALEIAHATRYIQVDDHTA